MYKYLLGIILWVVLMEIEYGKTADNTENGNINRIFGGMNADIGEFPWMVGIWWKNATTQTLTLGCGGSIIKRQWVVTAAHCLDSPDATSYFLYFGKTNLNNMEPFEKILGISKFYKHPEYNPKTLANDIGLMKLREPLEYNRDIGPIMLSKPGETFDNEVCVTSGWGLISFDDYTPTGKIINPNLQRLSLKNWPAEKCDKTPNFLCSGGLPEGGKSACQGDSGGPVRCSVKGEFVLIGLVSHGKSCGKPNEPDYSTSISYYHDWIIETILKDFQ